MRTLVIILLTILQVLNSATAQKIRNASGMAQFRLEDNMSKDDLKEKLRHHAKINAIEREFGTYITQESYVDIDNGNAEFRIFGKTLIRGEWLKTTNEQFREEIRVVKDGRSNTKELWMNLKIDGQVRELTKPGVDFSFFTTNCRKEACKTNIFHHGEPFYLNFRTPVDGYLTVYMIENKEAFRLLPYKNMPASYSQAIPVKADQDYLFFSPYEDQDYFEDFSRFLVDEMVMLAEHGDEFVNMVVVFSTDEFVKPGLVDGFTEAGQQYEIPMSLTAKSLQNWLEINRINNENFYYRQLTLKIVH